MAYGFVLVGGMSRRMGQDKARLLYRGRPMALHQADKLSFVCGRAALVGKGTHPFPLSGFRFVEDEAEPHAAVYGILAALSWSPDDINVILASDMPRCPESFLAALLEVAEAVQAPVVVPMGAGGLQPLCSVWRKGAVGVLRDSIQAGQMSIRYSIDRLGGVIIPEEETARMPGGRPESFLNINRPEDYEELTRDGETLASRR